MALTGDFVTGRNLAFARMRRRDQDCNIQEGVLSATSFQVKERGAGANMSVDVAAGTGWVAIDTGLNNGLSHVQGGATENVTISAADGTYPRIDQLVLQYNDTSIPTGVGGNIPTFRVIAGTPSSGATLANRTGAAALPNDCTRYADILVPAKTAAIEPVDIRDRRPWASRFKEVLSKTNARAETTSSSFEAIDTTRLQVRVECVGNPIRFILNALSWATVTPFGTSTGLFMDGASLNVELGGGHSAYEATPDSAGFNWVYTPAAGSHLFAPAYARGQATGTSVLQASATEPIQFQIEELKPNGNNGTS